MVVDLNTIDFLVSLINSMETQLNFTAKQKRRKGLALCQLFNAPVVALPLLPMSKHLIVIFDVRTFFRLLLLFFLLTFWCAAFRAWHNISFGSSFQ